MCNTKIMSRFQESQAARLDAKLSSLSHIPCVCHTNSTSTATCDNPQQQQPSVVVDDPAGLVSVILDDILDGVVSSNSCTSVRQRGNSVQADSHDPDGTSEPAVECTPARTDNEENTNCDVCPSSESTPRLCTCEISTPVVGSSSGAGEESTTTTTCTATGSTEDSKQNTQQAVKQVSRYSTSHHNS